VTSPGSGAQALDAERLNAWTRALFGPDARSDAELQTVRDLATRVVAVQSNLGGERDLDGFFAHLALRLPTEETREGDRTVTAPALEHVCVEDLYLAYCCASGEARALKVFEQEVGRELEIALARLRVPAEHHDDVRQELYQKLFTGERPKILEYSGRGKLRYWFGVAAMRALIDERRRKRPDDTRMDDRHETELVAPTADPEIEHLKRLYSHEFNTAFEEAIGALDAGARNILRSYYRFQMTIDQIASAYGIHRATAARRVQRAREALLADTRRILAERLHLETAELISILKLIESRLDVSLNRLLE
jgi:RNA polymerase sigma-70 factor (ECF subfamily)